MESFEFGMTVTLLGFAVVVITLLLLFILITLFSVVLNHEQGRSEKNDRTNKEDQGAICANSVSHQVAAVITAAVSATWNYPGRPFTVTITSKPVENNGWILLGRKQQLEGRRRLEFLRRQRPS